MLESPILWGGEGNFLPHLLLARFSKKGTKKSVFVEITAYLAWRLRYSAVTGRTAE